MAQSRIILVFMLFFGLTSSQNSGNDVPQYKHESKLKQDLLVDYDKRVLPQESPDYPVNVTIKMMLNRIEHLDIDLEVLRTNLWISIKWHDERLRWKHSENNGIESFDIPVSQIWVPDITPWNGAGERYVAPYGDAVLSSDGSVLIVHPVFHQSSCAIDLEYYPFDQQACEMKFGSWVHNGNKLRLRTDFDTLDTSVYYGSKEWSLVDTNTQVNALKYDCCPEPYYVYSVTIRIQRRAGMLLHLYLCPAICFLLIVPAVFLLPPDSNHKLVLGGTLLISQVLVLNMLADSLPAAVFSPPKIAMFQLGSIVLLCLSLACSVLVLNTWGRANRTRKGVPVVINRIFLGIFGRLLCVQRDDFLQKSPAGDDNSTETDSDHHVMVNEYSRVVVPAEWRQLAMVFDRLLLVLFLLSCLILVVVMLVYNPRYS